MKKEGNIIYLNNITHNKGNKYYVGRQEALSLARHPHGNAHRERCSWN